MKPENTNIPPWTAAHQTMLTRLMQGLDSLGATYHIKAGGQSYGVLQVQPEKTRVRVNDFVAKYDYVNKIAAFDGGTLELFAEPGEAEKLRAVALCSLAKKFDAGNYTTTVEGDLVTIVAYGSKTPNNQPELSNV